MAMHPALEQAQSDLAISLPSLEIAASLSRQTMSDARAFFRRRHLA